MLGGRHALAAAALAALAAAPAPALGARARPARAGGLQALLSSSELWATIDACNPSDQPYTVAIRGSMPGDGRARDRMYMSFRLQYLTSAGRRWVDVAKSSSGFTAVGSGLSARQGGTSFELAAGKMPFTLRGVVTFQWRRGSSVLLSASRPTTAAHRGAWGADPAGYSAATCLLS